MNEEIKLRLAKIENLVIESEKELQTIKFDYKKLEGENKRLKEGIWKEINNAHYLGDMKSRNFYNLINDVAEIINPNYEEIGKEFIE